MEAELHPQPFLELWVNFIAKAMERKVSIIYLSCRADFSTHKGLHIPLFHVLYGGFITLWSSALGLHTSISQMRWGIWFCNNDSLLRSPDSCRLCLYSPNCLWMKLIPAASQPSQTHLSQSRGRPEEGRWKVRRIQDLALFSVMSQVSLLPWFFWFLRLLLPCEGTEALNLFQLGELICKFLHAVSSTSTRPGP